MGNNKRLTMRVMLVILALVVNGAAMVVTIVSSSALPCKHYAAEDLLDRVDAHFALCFPEPTHVRALDAFKDALIANEFESTSPQHQQNKHQQNKHQRQRPLSLVAFSDSVPTLDRFASAVSTAVFGVSPARHAVRVIDFALVLSKTKKNDGDSSSSSLVQSNYALQRQLRHEMATAIAACPQRTLFLVRNTHLVMGDRLPLLDVFLDPMNGERAQLHDAENGRDLDTRQTMFLFLYHHADTHSSQVGKTWRDFLVDTWKKSATLAKEAFTPQALVGRLTAAVVLQGEDAIQQEKEDEEDSKHWRDVCGLQGFLTRLEAAQHGHADASSSSSWAAVLLVSREMTGIFMALLFVLAVVIKGKWWAVDMAHLYTKTCEKKEKKEETQRQATTAFQQQQQQTSQAHTMLTEEETEVVVALSPLVEPTEREEVSVSAVVATETDETKPTNKVRETHTSPQVQPAIKMRASRAKKPAPSKPTPRPSSASNASASGMSTTRTRPRTRSKARSEGAADEMDATQPATATTNGSKSTTKATTPLRRNSGKRAK